MTQPVIKISDVWVRFDGHVVLREQNLVVHRNDFLGIIGPNGGGKTTLLKVILGLVEPCQGRVEVLGQSPSLSRQKIGYVPQISFFDRDFPISVFETVLTGRLSVRGLFRRFNASDKDATLKALDTVDIKNLKDRQIGKLSGGERQRVFIARALVSQPEVLLLDEPTASVDPQMKTGIYDLLGELKKKMTIILVTHDMGVISTHVNKIACLNERLFYHDDKHITRDMLEQAYHCPVDLIAHGVAHRVLDDHFCVEEEA
jgi:zinc transport system ATP-binding protein